MIYVKFNTSKRFHHTKELVTGKVVGDFSRYGELIGLEILQPAIEITINGQPIEFQTQKAGDPK